MRESDKRFSLLLLIRNIWLAVDSLFLLSTDYVLQLQHSPVSSAQLSIYLQRTKVKAKPKTDQTIMPLRFSYFQFSYLLPLAFLHLIFLPSLSFSHQFFNFSIFLFCSSILASFSFTYPNDSLLELRVSFTPTSYGSLVK